MIQSGDEYLTHGCCTELRDFMGEINLRAHLNEHSIKKQETDIEDL